MRSDVCIYGDLCGMSQSKLAPPQNSPAVNRVSLADEVSFDMQTTEPNFRMHRNTFTVFVVIIITITQCVQWGFGIPLEMSLQCRMVQWNSDTTRFQSKTIPINSLQSGSMYNSLRSGQTLGVTRRTESSVEYMNTWILWPTSHLLINI